MFESDFFDKYSFEHIPLNRDIYLVDEKWMQQYESLLLKVFDGAAYEAVGYVSPAAARSIHPVGIEFSWYPNHFTRFHEVTAWLPKDAFVCCVGCWQYDEKPRIFVKGAWLNQLHLRSYTVFALVDAINVKAAIRSNALTREKLVDLRSRIDDLAADYPEISFVSFADSLLLKSNWTVGHFESDVKYTYEPEIFLHVIVKLKAIYREVLGLGIYAALTQGSNEYYEDDVTHISKVGNHISLNSLGVPFAQLLAIDETARKAFKAGVHPACELYMDELFFRSLDMKFEFEKSKQPSHNYQAPMSEAERRYFYTDAKSIISNLRADGGVETI